MSEQVPVERKKASHIGAPAVFKLELACRVINQAFGCGFGCYKVGSSMERADWRDVDVRLILGDDEFAKQFPAAHLHGAMWEHDPKWLLFTVAITGWLREQTGLPIDFQIQPQTFANEKHKGIRSAVGLVIQPRSDEQDSASPEARG